MSPRDHSPEMDRLAILLAMAAMNVFWVVVLLVTLAFCHVYL